MDQRTLTDADLDALADRVIQKFEKRFYIKLGEGLWGMVWKVIMLGIVAIAGYKLWGR